MFCWTCSEELLPASIDHALKTVKGLQKGRTEAREPDPIGPVSDQVVDATLDYLPAVIADLVRLQRLTGARPGEICQLRPGDVDRRGEIWEYRPATHKSEHYGKERTIYIGPKGQAILLPYLLRPADAFCFSAGWHC
jgi:integrase